MAITRRTFCQSLLLGGASVALPRRSAAADSFDAAPVDAAIVTAMKAWKVPGVAAAIVREGDVIYLKGHGVKESNGTDAVTPDTLFPIGSCTKAFTTTAMGILVDDGKMSWDDPVRKHLPYFHLSDPLADKEVALRDLVCHRTGLGTHDLLWYRSPFTPEEAVRRAGSLPLDHPFRTRFQYQTTMVAAAGLAVAAASAKPWDEFVQTRLLDPLEMSATCFTTTAAAKAADHSGGHRLSRRGAPETTAWLPMEAPQPAVSMCSSARDLAKWLRFQLGDGTTPGGKKLLSAAALPETHTPQMVIPIEGTERDLQPETTQMSYAMAWVVQDYRGVGLCSHSGAMDGFRAHLTMIPKKNIGIAIIANLHHTRMNLALSNAIVDLLLGLRAKDWNAVVAGAVRKGQEAEAEKRKEREDKRRKDTKPSRELAAYAGSYENPAYGTAKAAIDKGRLTWTWGQFTSPLEHLQFDAFTASLEDLAAPEVVFALNDDGDVSSMKVLAPMDAEFKKK
jgi:CubicO group peptidase (beta-lactamase class C family)